MAGASSPWRQGLPGAVSLARVAFNSVCPATAATTTVGRKAEGERALRGRTAGVKTSRMACCTGCPTSGASADVLLVKARVHGPVPDGNPLGCKTGICLFAFFVVASTTLI